MKKLALYIAIVASSTNVHAKDWTIVRFGVDASYPPFASKSVDGGLVGFDIDLGNQICAHLKAKCVWVENDFDGMIPALKARKFDGVLSSMSITPKRAEQINFSDRLYKEPRRLVAKKGSGLLPTPESLAGKVIGVEQGSTEETYAKTYWEPKGAKIMSYQSQDQVYTDLLSGRLDAALQDQVQADLGFLRTPRGSGFQFVGAELVDEKVLGSGTGIGLRKEDIDLRVKINKAIADMIRDGTYKRIERKYFDFDIYGG